jgi:hypothetical protein
MLDLATVPLTKNNEPKHVPLNAAAQAALSGVPPPSPEGEGVAVRLKAAKVRGS